MRREGAHKHVSMKQRMKGRESYKKKKKVKSKNSLKLKCEPV